MVTFPSWGYFACVLIVFPLFYVIIQKQLKFDFRSPISKQFILEIIALAILVFCCVIAMDIFKSDIVAFFIIFPIAAIVVFFIFYGITKGLKDYRDIIKSMTTKISCGMQEMTAASEQITMSTLTIAQKAQEINISSENITKLLSILETVSDQINLLSLNATIEAGRLGPEARGFMAVASELQKLHGETKNQINKSAREARTIVSEIHGFSNSASEISTATEEQTSSMEEIMNLIETLNKKVEGE